MALGQPRNFADPRSVREASMMWPSPGYDERGVTVGAQHVESLLALDRDLAHSLSPERARAAARDVRVVVTRLRRGAWRPEQDCPPAATDFGLLVLSGVIIR